MIKLYCVIEVADADTVERARQRLTAFREAIVPSANYGLTIYQDNTRKDLIEALESVVSALDDASSVVDAGEDEDNAYERELEFGRRVLAAAQKETQK